MSATIRDRPPHASWAGATAGGDARPMHGAAVARSSGAQEAEALVRVNRLGDRASHVGLAIGLFLAIATHGAGSARALTMLVDMRDAVHQMRQGLHEYFWASYSVDVVRDPTPPKPEDLAPEEPEPEPEPPPPAPTDETAPDDAQPVDPYDEPAAPAEAAEILTAPTPANEPVDLTQDGFVTGHGTGPTYGYVSAAGTSKAATFDPNAKVGGREGGRGTELRPPPPPKVNRSRPAGVQGGKEWNCPFPAEADAEQINRATATVVVTVAPDGRPAAVSVLSDPGYGFGRAARQCALSRRYVPALDPDGQAIRSTTPPIIVRFRR